MSTSQSLSVFSPHHSRLVFLSAFFLYCLDAHFQALEDISDVSQWGFFCTKYSQMTIASPESEHCYDFNYLMNSVDEKSSISLRSFSQQLGQTSAMIL